MVYDSLGRQLFAVYAGNEPTYVIDDSGFERHVASGEVDRQAGIFSLKVLKVTKISLLNRLQNEAVRR